MREADSKSSENGDYFKEGRPVKKLEIIYKGIDEVIPYENTPRINDDAVSKVVASIKEFGFKNPIIVDKDNVILAGHTRHRAAQELGLDQVPTIIIDDIDKDRARAFRIADNRTSDSAFWDVELLEEILLELQEDTDMDLEEFGFEEIEAKDLFEEVEVKQVELGEPEKKDDSIFEVVITCFADEEVEDIMEIFGFEEEGQKLRLNETKIWKERRS